MARQPKEVIEARRAQVWEMSVRGVPQPAIAQALGVHRNTIYNDLQQLRKEHRAVVQDADVHDQIGDIVAKYDEIFRYAMNEYSTAEKPSQKAQFLDKGMSVLAKKVGLLVETGVLPKAAQEITGKMVIQGVDVTKASLEELRTLRHKMKAQLGEEVVSVPKVASDVVKAPPRPKDPPKVKEPDDFVDGIEMPRNRMPIDSDEE